MITVITGTPGAGKTLYAITKLVKPLIGAKVAKTDENGSTVEIERKVYTNIKGLQLDHELIDDSNTGGLRNWHEWAEPGAVIVYDEFQKPWPPRPNGSKVPDDIQALDTHRHKGVDFILITQNVINVDRHVHGLVGRHLHVRRMGNMPLTIVYEWDHCSRSLMYSKSVSKSPWRYDKSVFKLYHSADLHTKQTRRIPSLVYFVLVGLVGFMYLAPTTYARIVERVKGEVAAAPGQTQLKPAEAAPTLAQKALSEQPKPDPVEFVPGQTNNQDNTQTQPTAALAGCVAFRTSCSCYDTAGAKIERSAEFCQAQTTTDIPKVDLAILKTPPPSTRREDIQLIQDVEDMKKRPDFPPLDWMAHFRSMDPVPAHY